MDTANFSPPVEIVILDYNSPDDCREYVKRAMQVFDLDERNSITYRKYTGRDHYHMAHARNLSVRAATGEYIVITAADIYFALDVIEIVRDELAEHQYIWLYDQRYKGVIVCQRREFVAAGGYDERFEFYGPEDRDLHDRLLRRCGKNNILPRGLVHVIETPNEDKVKNYREPLSKREMSQKMHPIYLANVASRVLVANPEGWGKWE